MKNQNSIRDKERRAWYHSHGLCARCREPLEKERRNKMYCNLCKATQTELTAMWRDRHPEWKEKDNERTKLRYERRKAEHRCRSCGVKLPDDDVIHAHCDACRKKKRIGRQKNRQEVNFKQREYYERRRKAAEAEHRCVRCGEKLPEDETLKTCLSCRQKDRAYNRSWRSKRK